MNERIVMLSGGHGGARIARELLRQSPCSITLVINALDDGKSTGRLRAFIPGMLGPSDIRKNLSQLLAVVSPERFYLAELLEYRLNEERDDWDQVLNCLANQDSVAGAPPAFARLIDGLQDETRDWVRSTVGTFLEYERAHEEGYEWKGAAFGNLSFAGAYLASGEDFNRACANFAGALLPELRVVNATASGSYFLRGVTTAGTPLLSEADVITPPAGEEIEEIFIHEEPVYPTEASKISAADKKTVRCWLEARAVTPPVSAEATEAIREMDALVIAPGTPHSSLFPTLMVLSDQLRAARAPVRLLIGNLDPDDDAVSLDNFEMVRQTLRYGGDPENQTPLITDMLTDPTSTLASERDRMIGEKLCVRVAAVPLRSPRDRKTHSASATATATRDLLRRGHNPRGRSLYVVVDPDVDDLLLGPLIDDFCDIRWERRFDSVHLLHAGEADSAPAPEYGFSGKEFEASITATSDPFQSARELIAANTDASDGFLLHLSGDGYYSLADCLGAVELIDLNQFDVVVGSRVQNRRQLSSSLKVIYGERRLQRRLADAGAGLISVAIRVREGFWLSDPLSGFVLYRTRSLDGWGGGERLPSLRNLSVAGMEVGEMPVRYFALAGFTTPSARIKRGLKVLGRAAVGKY